MSRTLANSTIPLEGKININQPIMLVAQQATGIYILCLVKYLTVGPDNSQYELIFSPYFSGDFKPPTIAGPENNTNNLILGLSYNSQSGLYEQVSTLTAVNTESSPTDFYKIDTVTVAILLFNPDGTYSVVNANGNFIGFINVFSGLGNQGLFQCAVIKDTGTPFINTPKDEYFTFPNIYAGEAYTFEYGLYSPFRFFTQMNNYQHNYLLTPSVCLNTLNANIPHKTNEYECNQYNSLSLYNLLRFIDYFSHTDSQTQEITNIAKANSSIAGSPQTDETFYNFYPTNFYLSNAFFQGGKLTAGPSTCYLTGNPTLNYDASSFMQYSYYFWASGFSAFSNGVGSESGIISQGSPGFIGKGNDYTVNITGWTNPDDCQRSYFYTYCDPKTTAATCGQCLGSCPSQPCSIDPDYLPPTPQGSYPFMCGLPPVPPAPSRLDTIWENNKRNIIILIVVIIIVGGAFIFFVISTLKSNKNTDPDSS